MVEDLNNALNTYYDTIFKTGYMSIKQVQNLFILDFLIDTISDPDYLLYATPYEQGLANELYNCIVQNNCLIQK